VVRRCTWREPSDPFRQRLEALPPSPEGREEEAMMGPVRHGTDPYDGAYSLILSVPTTDHRVWTTDFGLRTSQIGLSVG
jgi:hypothetical protein